MLFIRCFGRVYVTMKTTYYLRAPTHFILYVVRNIKSFSSHRDNRLTGQSILQELCYVDCGSCGDTWRDDVGGFGQMDG